MKPRSVRRLTKALWAGAIVASTLLAACSIYNPFGGYERGYIAPRRIGEGECSSEVINLSGRALEVYFYFGLDTPPRIIASWPRLGVLAPLKSSVIHGPCEHRRITIFAYATGPVDPQHESSSTRRAVALVRGRRDIIRLRLAR